MRRRHHKRELGTVDMNLAAMLDMAFQLLTFFILTFRPAPIEGQLALHMPHPAPIQIEGGNDRPLQPVGLPQDVQTLHLQVTADGQGDVETVSIERAAAIEGPVDHESLAKLNKKLQAKFGMPHTPFEQVQIAIDGKIRYGELMKIIDVCAHQKRPDGEFVRKVAFTEL